MLINNDIYGSNIIRGKDSGAARGTLEISKKIMRNNGLETSYAHIYYRINHDVFMYLRSKDKYPKILRE
jgi:hypothetical protein